METVRRLYRWVVGVSRRHPGFDRPVPRLDDLDSFAGLWVAIKDGEVIATAPTSTRLVYEVQKLGPRGEDAVVELVQPASDAAAVGAG